MKNLNLDTEFDENLRDYPVNPDDFRHALSEFEKQFLKSTEPELQVKILGQIGTHQRILGLLNEANGSFKKAIALAASLKNSKLKLVNLIRLGHVKHWKANFSEAHRIFEECFEMINQDKSLEEYRDFVFQHKGKTHFDEGKYELALKNFYEAILIRNNKSESDLADSTLLAIEETKRRWLPQVSQSEIQKILENKLMPNFVGRVIGKKAQARLNCINAALNFHDIEMTRQLPFKPMELLQFLHKNCKQLSGLDEYQFGDFVVWWNRSGGSWDNRKIIVKDMNFNDADFPYGLIFDHVAVRVSEDIVFNKPNPSPDSEYRFDRLNTASCPSKLGKGYEVTFHRKS